MNSKFANEFLDLLGLVIVTFASAKGDLQIFKLTHCCHFSTTRYSSGPYSVGNERI